MADGDGNPRLSLRNGEVVQRRMPSIQVIMTATPRQVMGGDMVTLTWGVTEGHADFHDWLGLFQENDDRKSLKHCYVKSNKRGGEWTVEAPREAGKYVFRFIKSLFPYDLIHKDYLKLGRSNVWEVVEPGAHEVDAEASAPADSSRAAASPYAGLGTATGDAEGAATPGSSQGSASPMVSSFIGLTPPGRTAGGHRRSGSAGSASLLSGQLATHAEGIVGRLPAHPLAWILRQFSSEDELAGLRLEDVVELAHQVEDDQQACMLAKRLAAAAHQPGPVRRAVVDAGGVWALLNLAKWDYPEIQKHAAHGLHSLVTFVPTLYGGMHDPAKRLLTFGADFPHVAEPLTPGALAQAGFFSQPLEPGSDRVICIACGVILEGWIPGQESAEMHAQVSPHCRLLNWPNVSGPASRAGAASVCQRDVVSQTDALAAPHRSSLSPVGWRKVVQAPDAGGGSETGGVPPALAGASSAASSGLARWSSTAGGNPLAADDVAISRACSEAACRPSVVTWWPLGGSMRGNHELGCTAVHMRAPWHDASSPQATRSSSIVASASDNPTSPDKPKMLREDSGAGVWVAGSEDAGGVGVLELGSRGGGGFLPGSASPGSFAEGAHPGQRTRTMDRSVARELLESPDAEQALAALAASTDKTVQGWWHRLLAALAYAAGTTKEFETMCLPRLLQAVKRCKDEERLLNLLEALRWLALQPAARAQLITALPLDTLINALPKWSGRNLEVANRNGAAPSDVWPRLLENAMCILQHTFATLVASPTSELDIPDGATAAVVCVLREAPFEHAEVHRSAVACLHSLVAACGPVREPSSQSAAAAGGAGAERIASVHPGGVGNAAAGSSGGAGGSAIFSRRKGMRDVRDITSPEGTVKRLVEIMVRGGDLNLRTSAARLLGKLIVLRPCICLEIAYVGVVDRSGSSTGDDLVPLEGTSHSASGMCGDGGVTMVDGITALLWLARDTGAAKSAAASSGSSDVLCQRMVAKCLESISLTCYLDPSLTHQLVEMGFTSADATQALRVGGGTLECAVTWLTTESDETPGGPEDEFEMVEEAPIDLPGMLISSGGLNCMAEMLQEQDAEVQVSLWKAVSALTRSASRCHKIFASKLGQEWIVPLIENWSTGSSLMAGTDRNSAQQQQGIAGAGGAARDSVGSCILEVVANLAAHAETCQKLLPHGIVLLLAAAAKAASSCHVVGARTCARGLFYTLTCPLYEGQEQYEAWWPSDPAIAGGAEALLHLCRVTANTGVQRWTGMALHRLCLKASQVGWTSLLECIIAHRGAQSLLHLVYSKALEVSAYAMATLALLSSSAHCRVFNSSSSDLVSAKRALFLAGVIYPVNKIGRQGCLDSKLAAGQILANLSMDESTLEDMLTGGNETLELVFHLLSLSPANAGQAARRDQKLIASSCAPLASREEAVRHVRRCALEVLEAVCAKERFQPRFLNLSGLQVLYDLAQSEAARDTVTARSIVKIIESLASNDSLRQVLADGGVKDVVKSLFKRHEDPSIGVSMEVILVELNRPARGERAAAGAGDGRQRPMHEPDARGVGRQASSANPSVGSPVDAAAGAGDWKVNCQRSLGGGEGKEQWVFAVPHTLSFKELQSRVWGKYGPVVITFQDEQDEEVKVLSGDDMLAHAMVMPRAARKRKLHIQLAVITPPDRRVAAGARDPDVQDPGETNPHALGDDDCEAAVAAPSRDGQQQQQHTQPMISRLCDRSPNFRHGGESGEGPTLRWRLGKRIGEGAYAQVYQGINADTGELMAIKQVSLQGGHEHGKRRQEEVSALQREIEVMKQLQHDNIVKYLGTETADGRLNIFLEFVSGGSIAHLISSYGALDEPIVRKYTRQILVGLDFLHDKGIVHCDIKGGNILVTEDGIIKLADFNSSKQLGNIAGGGSNPLRSLLGTPQFMAPEVIRQTGHGKKADIWSVGCTCIQMLTGAPPWDEISNKITLMFHIASCKTPPQPPDNVSEEAAEFLRHVLQIEPRDRPGCQELLGFRWLAKEKQAGGVSRVSSVDRGALPNGSQIAGGWGNRGEAGSDGMALQTQPQPGDFFDVMREEVKRKGAAGI